YPATVDEVRALHEELAAMAAHAPDRLKCVGTIQPPEQGPGTYWDVLRNNRLVEEAYRDYGFIGVHLTPSPWGIAPNDRWFYPLYTKCVELGLTVFTYVGMPAALWPMYPNHPLHLDDVALAFPDLRIVAHHIGDPWVDVIVRLAAKHPNIYICTSAWSPKRYPAELMRFMREGWHRQPGTEKVMFGSDYPLLDLKKTTDDARRLDLPEDGLRQFLYETAKRLFWGEEE
ncbi:MAG TPA: amidohydrolase family protein, partial [Bacillota bacterium]